jgi:hypothetical protein
VLRSKAVFLIGCLVLAGSCRRAEPPSPALARVDAETLTLEQVVQRFDTARGVSQSQIHDYVQQWMTNELLYREAVRRGLDHRPEIDEQLADIRRQLAIQALLENEVYSTGPEAVTDSEVKQYFGRSWYRLDSGAGSRPGGFVAGRHPAVSQRLDLRDGIYRLSC